MRRTDTAYRRAATTLSKSRHRRAGLKLILLCQKHSGYPWALGTFRDALKHWADRHNKVASDVVSYLAIHRHVDMLILSIKAQAGDFSRSAAYHLGKLGGIPAVDCLGACARDSSTDYPLRREAIRALARIGVPAALLAVRGIVKDGLNRFAFTEHGTWRDGWEGEHAVLDSIAALDEAGDQEAIPILLEAFRAGLQAIACARSVEIETNSSRYGSTFAEQLVDGTGRGLIKLVSRSADPAAARILEEIAAVRNVVYRRIVTVNHPGDTAFEQLHHDGRGPSQEISEHQVGFDDLAVMAQDALLRVRRSE